MVSEENEEAILVEGSQGQYIAVFDPLDGSSNIDGARAPCMSCMRALTSSRAQ
jgi:fructose-1,6-bisphosphatase